MPPDIKDKNKDDESAGAPHSDHHNEIPPEKNPEGGAEDVAKKTRISIPAIEEGVLAKNDADNKRYAFGEKFDLNREIENGNISAEAGKFIREWPIAEEILSNMYEETMGDLCEYDGYTYIHTVQMLNLASGMTNAEFDEIRKAIEFSGKKDKRFDFAESDFRDIFLGAIVFHDWGKTRIDRDILNYPESGGLPSDMYREMKKHAMGTVDILVSEIVGSVYTGIDIKEPVERNRILREINNEAKYIVDEINRIIGMAFGGGNIEKDLQCFAEDAVTFIDIISKINPGAEKLRVDMQVAINAISNGDYYMAKKHMNNINEIVDGIKEVNRQSMRKIQHKIKKQINDILTGNRHDKEKKLFQMVYLAASHHHAKKYPTHEELDGVLPDYKIWFESSGEDQATILAIFDVADALLSPRAYKEGMDEVKARELVDKIFLYEQSSREKYEGIIQFVFDYWEKMQGADEYTKRRKEKEVAIEKK
jgi:HD-GYP domain-containing protein (c-di-GMP phosphodiesterase class II)